MLISITIAVLAVLAWLFITDFDLPGSIILLLFFLMHLFGFSIDTLVQQVGFIALLSF